jgi:hypothetical protein
MSRINPLSGSRQSPETSLWGERVMEELTGYDYEARAYPRTKLTSEIVVRPTNGLGSVFGTPFNAVTVDISPSGIGFLHTAAVPDKYLAILLGTNGRRKFVLVEVVRCRAVGNFYEIGAQFIRPLESVGS